MIRAKQGGFTDLFLFIVLATIVVFISGVFIYFSNTVTPEVKEKISQIDGLSGDGLGNNATQVVDNTLGVYQTTIGSLRWISVFIIVGMVLGIFIGSYMVQTRPVFFIPYLFLLIIAVIVSVPISNTYENLLNDATLGATYQSMGGASFIFEYLPIWVTVIGIGGAIIMFALMGKRQDQVYGGYYG